MPGDALVAHRAAGMLGPDEKRSQNCIHNGRKNDIDEDRIIHHPDLAVLPGVDSVDYSHGSSEKRHQRRQKPEGPVVQEPGEVCTKQFKHDVHL